VTSNDATSTPPASHLAVPGPATSAPTWPALLRHRDELASTTLRELFAADAGRVERFTRSAVGIHADLSKQRITDHTLELLMQLAGERGLAARIEAMFTGAHINTTEDRAVLHVALRLPRDATLVVDGIDVVAEVHDVLDRMAAFADKVRSGEWLGATGERIRAVVNIGIGGSDLGPVMAYDALRYYSDRDITFRFVSNIDGADIREATRDLDPASTLFIVSSKTFTTQETMTNAQTARDWLTSGLGDRADVAKHFVAVSTNSKAVTDFGIDATNMFGFWEWVGGRYSMDSAIGLSTMLAVGPEGFAELLAGFHAMDEHFRTTPFEHNLPVLMGLLQVWNRNFLGCPTQAVLPYDNYLLRFPAYLQQLTMESNGKSVTLAGDPVGVDTGAIWWGEPGTNGQHSFYQLLHQGTATVPADFLLFAKPAEQVGDHQPKLAANVLAQTHVLAFGRTADEVAAEGVALELVPHKVMPGNRPSTTLLLERLTPYALGTVVALYEHATFTAGTIWGIDSFDQWGVELGKVMAGRLLPAVAGEADAPAGFDASTLSLLAAYRHLAE
jgi:glucose-6-phosphate isomerase